MRPSRLRLIMGQSSYREEFWPVPRPFVIPNIPSEAPEVFAGSPPNHKFASRLLAHPAFHIVGKPHHVLVLGGL